MSERFASGKHAIANCDICGFQYKLKRLRVTTVKRTRTNLLVCPECWNPPHPQSFLGEKPVHDPQALRNARPDTSYDVAGSETLGSRVIQWGWNPVGGSRDGGLTPNNLNLTVSVGNVTVTAT